MKRISKALVALLVLAFPFLVAGGWADITTNWLGIRLGPSMAKPSDGNSVAYQSSSNSWITTTAGGGGGGVTSIVAGANITVTNPTGPAVTISAAGGGSGGGFAPYSQGTSLGTTATGLDVNNGLTASLAGGIMKITPTYGTSANTFLQGNDPSVTNARTPTAHHVTHQNGGSDEVATAAAAANAIPKAGAGGTLAIGWVPTGSTSTTVPLGNDSRFPPTPGTVNKVVVDTGSAYTSTLLSALFSGGTGISITGSNPLTVAVSLTAGTGIGVSGATISNTGVTSAVAGTGITVSGAAGAITFGNGGVLSLAGGTGLGVSASTGAITLSNTGVTSNVAGTGISVTGATGASTIAVNLAAGTGIGVSGATISNTGVTSVVAGNNMAVSNSTGTVNVSYSALNSPINAAINGDFQVWTWGSTSISATANTTSYTADMWAVYPGATGAATVSQQAHTLGQTAVPNEPHFYLRYNQTTNGTGNVYIQQKTLDVRKYAGQTITFSFYAFVPSGSVSVTPTIQQYFGSGGSPTGTATTAGTAQTVSATTFTRYSTAINVPSISGDTIGTNTNTSAFIMRLALPTGSTYTVNIADVQVELGSSATAYGRRPYSVELFDCQFYHYRITSEVNNQAYGFGDFTTTTTAICPIFFPRQMVRAPTITSSSGNTFRAVAGSTAFTGSATSFLTVSTLSAQMNLTVTGATAGAAHTIQDLGSSTSFINFDAGL